MSSVQDSTGFPSNGDSDERPSLSADGRYVVFRSYATNLAGIDLNGEPDIFLRDHQTGRTTYVSRASGADPPEANGLSIEPSISADGRFVAFTSDATNLVVGDTNGQTDVFVRDLQTNTTRLVSRSSGAGPPDGDGRSREPGISADGRFVAFRSESKNLVGGDINEEIDVFVRDLQTDTTTLVSRSSGEGPPDADGTSLNPTISADGRFVAFDSEAANLVAGDTNAVTDVFVRDLQSDTTAVVSRSSGVGTPDGVDQSQAPAISADGRYVAFRSLSPTLAPDTNGKADIFVRDLQAAKTTIVSRPDGAGLGGANGDSAEPAISADGRLVAFSTLATNLVAPDTNGRQDIIVRDRQTDTNAVVSRSSGAGPPDANGGSIGPSLSADGRFAGFSSAASNLVLSDPNGLPICSVFQVVCPIGGSGIDVFRRELAQPPLASVSVGDMTVTEGDSGEVEASFAVSLSAPSSQQVTVGYATANDSATAPSDYAQASGSVTFAPGDTSETVTVKVKGDTLDEPDERFLVNLSSPQGATVFDGQGDGTVTDDDPSPAVSIGDRTVTEGDSGELDATFTVSLSAPSGRQVQVGYQTADDGATAPGDYTAASGTVTFAPGDTSETVTVKVEGDVVDEPDERFLVNLSGPQNATVSDGQGEGTITDNDAPSADPAVSIADRTVTEGDSGDVDASFTVLLSASSSQQVTVAYQTADDSATAPADYASASGSVTFAPGDTSETVTVKVKGDTLDEPDERFLVNLSSPQGATVSDGQGEGAITDDDPSPAASIGDRTVTEGDSGELDATFTVSLSAPSGRQVQVGYGTADGIASAPSDYASTSGTVTFAPGDVSETVTVKVKGDVLDEPDERFLVNLSSPQNATLADGQGLGTITDNDAPPTVSIDDVTVGEGDVGQRDATFTVSLSVPSGREVTVGWATADDSATVPADYAQAQGTVTFAPGDTSETVTVKVKGDMLDEPGERFLVNLSSPGNATVADGQGRGTVTDDDPPPAVSIGDRTVTEGDSGEVDASFTVSLSAASGQRVMVAYATADDSATAPADFTHASGTVTFAPGDVSETVNVKVKGDTLDEPDERFLVNLSSPSNATVSDGHGEGRITDDDAPPAPPPSASMGDRTVTEGDSGEVEASFAVSLSAPSSQQVTVGYATANDSATAPSDYAQASGSVTFAPGDTSETVTVKVKGDTLDEPDERFLVNLSSPQGATVSDGQGDGTVTDDDPSPAVSIGDRTVTEGDSGELDATFTVSLSAPSGRQVQVGYQTADDGATAPGDYTAASGTVTFAPGDTSETVTVKVEGDTVDEPDERFLVNLSGPQNATVADGQGEGRITDDDSAPAASIGDRTVTEGDSGELDASFTVSLSAASGRQMTVRYATANDSATAPSDYTQAQGTVTFAPGDTSETVTVKVKGDALDEPDERFLVNLSSPSHATVGDGQGEGAITDDDPPPAGGGGGPSRPSAPAPHAGPDAMTGCRVRGPVIVTTAGDDARSGTAGDDVIFAGPGNDVIDALAGNDCIDLGSGADRAQGRLGDDLVLGGPGGDRIGGGAGDDRLLGLSGRDSISGGAGRDLIDGSSGDDRLTGGRGSDRISGGAGNDRIQARDDRRDRISCGSGRDRVTADRLDSVSPGCERVWRHR